MKPAQKRKRGQRLKTIRYDWSDIDATLLNAVLTIDLLVVEVNKLREKCGEKLEPLKTLCPKK